MQLWEPFGLRRHIVATLVQGADGLGWRTLCGRTFKRPTDGPIPAAYCLECSKAAKSRD
jgi:hypothetical protein